MIKNKFMYIIVFSTSVCFSASTVSLMSKIDMWDLKVTNLWFRPAISSLITVVEEKRHNNYRYITEREYLRLPKGTLADAQSTQQKALNSFACRHSKILSILIASLRVVVMKNIKMSHDVAGGIAGVFFMSSVVMALHPYILKHCLPAVALQRLYVPTLLGADADYEYYLVSQSKEKIIVKNHDKSETVILEAAQ